MSASARDVVGPEIPNNDNPKRVTGRRDAKAARLRLLKERHEYYLAERSDEDESDAESTRELRVIDQR